MNFCRRESDTPEIYLLPFIDVMLVILIFLMATMSYSRLTTLQLEQTTVQEEFTSHQHHITIHIDAQNHYWINQERHPFYDPRDFAKRIKNAALSYNNPVIIIHAEMNTSYQTIINVIRALHINGFTQIQFSTATLERL